MEAAESLGAGSEEWALAHEALSKLRLKRAALDAEEGRWLLRAFRAATHVHFGYASFGEYIALPELAEALRSAKLNWSVVRELSRVAVPETEHEWILSVCRKTAREVERLVSGLAPGDRPADRRRPEYVRHILRFEVGAETLATFRDAMKAVRKRSDQRLDDDAALLLMAREILGGPGDAGRASYQVAVTQCEDCGRGFQHANGELIELDPAIVEMCHCDAQKVPTAHPHAVVTDASGVHLGHAGDRGAGELAPARPHVDGIGDLAQGDGPRAASARLKRQGAMKRRRATQDTPPAIRRQVFWRDRGRCVVPGCRNATYVDLHHLDLRSEGGSNDPDNLVVLCGAHHGALHRGRLRIDGRVSTGLRVRHADGTAYGFMPSPGLAEASARAFEGLRNLGFSEKTARASLEHALSGAPANVTAETLLRSAVARASCG